MATNEMRAWLEKKIIAIEEWLPKIEKWTEDFMTAKRDMEMMQAILAALELKMTEWTPDRPCPKEGAELAGPGEEERKALLKWLVDYAERYSGLALSHSWAMIPVTEEDRKKWDKIRALILGHAAGEGEKQ